MPNTPLCADSRKRAAMAAPARATYKAFACATKGAG